MDEHVIRAPVGVRRMSWSLFAVALSVRVASVAIDGETPGGDTVDYEEIALNLLAGKGFVASGNWHGYSMYSWRPPLYPAFLAIVFGLAQFDHLWVMIVQTILGATSAVLLYRLGCILHPPTAIPAGAIAAIYWPLVTTANTVMSESLYIPLTLLSLTLLIADAERDDATRGDRLDGPALMAGVCTALAALTRPVALVIWPVAVAIIFTRRASTGRYWRSALWLSAGVVITLSPWTIRNYAVHDRFVAISTQGGFIAARSNTAEPAWRQARGWGIDKELFERIPTEVERERFWWRQAGRFVLDEPAVYARLVLERFLRFWYFMRPGYDFWYMSILPFFAVGLARMWRSTPYAYLTWYMAASLLLFCCVLYGSARFRLPMEPLLILYACAGAHAVRERWGTRALIRSAIAVISLNGMIWLYDDTVRRVVVDWLTAAGLK